MKKIITLSRTWYVNTNGLQTATTFKIKDVEQYWISLDYGKGNGNNTVIGHFSTEQEAQNAILSLY